ncbi:MAG: chromate transporter [Bdellovibrionales bacterium]
MIEFEIFWVFFKISFLSFGGVFGVLPELERMIVLEHGWLTHDQFIQSYVMAQFVPGPNMAMCPLVGYWVAGWTGMIAGFVGIYLGPVFIMIAAFLSYHSLREKIWMKKFEVSVRPVIVGLLASSTLNIWWWQTYNEQFLWISRTVALAIGAIFIWVYVKKKPDPLKLIFSFGFIWWFFQYSLTSL